MAIIKLVDLISCSSQAKGYGAENLMYYHLKKAWKSSAEDPSRQIEAEFQLYKASQIDFIDIGNSGSSTLEVLVGKSSNPTNYVTLLPAVTMLTFADLKGGVDKNAVYMFKEGNMVQDVAERKWDRVKVICRQPYSKKFQFGLKFLILRTKNDWEIQSNDENQDLFIEEKSYYSMPLSDQCSRQSDVPTEIISRGQQLVQASKAQHSLTSKSWEKEDSFKEDVRIFLIACSDEVFNGLSSDGCMAEFERQRQQKLGPKEKLLFRNVYLEFKICVSPPETDIEISSVSSSSSEDSLIHLGVIKNRSAEKSSISKAIHKNDCHIPSDVSDISFEEDSPMCLDFIENSSTDKSNINIPGLDIINKSNTLKSVSSLKLNTDAPKKSSLYKFDANNTSKAIHGKKSQLQDGNSPSVKSVSKFPVHISVSSLRSQQNLPDICKTVKLPPKYRHKELTYAGSEVLEVSESSISRNVHSSVKRRSEDSWGSGSVSKKSKALKEFCTRSKGGYYRPEDFIQLDGSQPSTSKGFTFVDCPICLESFHPSAIEKHAATCGESEDSDSQEFTETCPFCAAKFPSSKVELHIENCFRYH